MNYKNTQLNADYWKTVEAMWGHTTAQAVHWIFTAVFISAVLVGTFFVIFHIISVTLAQMKEHDKSLGDALKVGMSGMIKWIIMICVAVIAIPCIWEILFPFLIQQGFNPEAPIDTAISIGGIYA